MFIVPVVSELDIWYPKLASNRVPSRVLESGISSMSTCQQLLQYDSLIEEFKSVHKEMEAVKNSGYSTSELRKDIEEMEKEKDIVEKRIERMQRKVEGAPNVEATMEAVKQLRGEKEKQKELLAQRTEQRVVIQQADQRINRLEQQLKDIRAAAVGTTPEALLQKIEEETKVNTYIGNNVNNLKKAPLGKLPPSSNCLKMTQKCLIFEFSFCLLRQKLLLLFFFPV